MPGYRSAGLKLLAVMLAAIASVPALPAPALAAMPAAATRTPGKVVIVSIPSLVWEDVEAGYAPALARLAADASIGAMSVRTAGARTDQASAMVSIGAGNRARAYGARPRVRGDAATAPNAVPAEGGGAEVRGMSNLIKDNADLDFGAIPGALGDELHRRGLTTGVAGNADGGFLYPTSATRTGSGRDRRRFGALALADRSGKVDIAVVADEMAIPDPATLNGYRTNEGALLDAAARVISAADVSLIELSDTYREGQIAYGVLRDLDPVEGRSRALREAIRRDDSLLGQIVDRMDLTRDTLIVLGTANLGPTEPEILTPALMAGVGALDHGWLTSATTLRKGLIQVSDIGPGILRLLGHRAPRQMSGQPVHTAEGPESGRVAQLIRLQGDAAFHGRWVGTFFLVFVLLQVLLYSAAWARLRKRPHQAMPWGRRLTLGFMAVPAASLVLIVFHAHEWGWGGPLLVMLAFCAVLTFLALRPPWRNHPTGPPAFICAVTGALIVGDLLTGSHLQLSSLLGYSPVVAGRFYGLGNLSFAVLATSAVLLAAEIGSRYGRWGIRLAALIGLVTIVADAGNRFGADFGGILALVPAFGILLAMLSGRRISMLRLVALASAAVAVALLVGALDSLRPPDAQTHIGRFVGRLVQDGPGAVQDVIVRKARANWSLLTQSVLSWSVPVALAFLAIMLRHPYGKLRVALETQPGLREGLVAALVVNTLGFAVNDSGIAIPAMGLSIIAPFCLATIQGLTDPSTGPNLEQSQAVESVT
ncbi:MAG TPA: hypothetical protein VHJ40_03905 [Actinomycetota bacterium]|nr:hypothetical protein [Actinomycetota bacterium]